MRKRLTEDEKKARAKLSAKKYRETHQDKIKSEQKEYREKNQEKNKEYHKQYYKENKEKFQIYSKQQYEENKNEIIARSKEYYFKHAESIKELRAQYKEEKSIYNKNYYSDNHETILEYHRERNKTLKGRFRTAKGQAKKRNLEFNITFEEFASIAIQPCKYCNDYFRTEKGTGSGIDRQNNSIGYILANICSCCAHCNYLKSDIYTPIQTKAMVEILIKLETS